VKELLEAVEHVIGRGFNVKYGPRREGDSPVLVADNGLARQTIGWSPHDLKSMIGTAWNWHATCPCSCSDSTIPASAACRSQPAFALPYRLPQDNDLPRRRVPAPNPPATAPSA
jgi:hypothetical protein